MFKILIGEKNLMSFYKKETYERNKYKKWSLLDNI